MCYSVAYLEKKLSNLAARYKSLLPPGWSAQSSLTEKTNKPAVYYFVSGFSNPRLAVITSNGIEFLRWGLIPFWTKDVAQAQKLRLATLNAKGETVFQKPSFRGSIRSKRCLLPVNGFFEWRELQGKKYPYFIHKEDISLFSLGCIYDEWPNPESGEMLKTFSIITTPANQLLEVIHNRKKRMPLIISRDIEKQWLDTRLSENQILNLIKPYTGAFEAYTVSQMINNTRNDRNTPDAIKPVTYQELA